MAEQQLGSDGLTAQEAAFFESGGAQTDGLVSTLATGEQTAAAPQEPASQQQQQTQQQDGTQQQPTEPRMVPLAALQEERAERKRMRDEMQRLQQQQEALVNRILTSQQSQAQEAAPQIPDYSQDPVGHLRAQNELLQRQMQQLAGHFSGQQQQQQQWTQQQQAEQALANFIAADEQTFRAQAPDYDAAATFLQQSRADEYRALGMNNPLEIHHALRADLAAMTNIAQRNGTSIAEAAYNLAKSRGYRPAQTSAQGGQAGTQQQDAASRLAAISQGQQHAASLSQTGGAAPAPMSIEKLLAMDDGEFAKATGGMNWQKLNAELSSR